ncbi:MAG: transposase [Rhodobacteraceae bacterium]|nr:transposase [Paracoccaceae bacterium]
MTHSWTVDWRWCSSTCKRAFGCFGVGPYGYDPLVRFNCLLLGQWHLKAGARPQLRLDFMLFCGLELFAPVPDATTHCRLRNLR